MLVDKSFNALLNELYPTTYAFTDSSHADHQVLLNVFDTLHLCVKWLFNVFQWPVEVAKNIFLNKTESFFLLLMVHK